MPNTRFLLLSLAGYLPVTVAIAVSAGFPSAFAEEPTALTVESSLSRPLIDPQLPVSEVQAYTESHILPMPQFASVAEWEDYFRRMRQNVLQKVVFRGEAKQWQQQSTKAEWLDTIDGGPGYHIRKLRYEVVPGMWVAALLYEPDKLTGKVPVIMNVNGHDRVDGKAADYKQLRCINQAKRGMIALNVEWLGMGQLNTPGFGHYCMNQLDLCGTSGLAPFYLTMSRGLDILLQHEHADPNRVGVAGLSGGGWQTIFISSLDTRVTLCNPVAGYSSFKTRSRFLSDLGDSEQTPCDLATVTDYAHLTAMLAPRAVLLTNNAEDNCCFKAEHALPPLLEAAAPVYDAYAKPERLRYHVNHDPGTHNFGLDNRQQLYGLLGDFFFPEDSSFSAVEIVSDDELKTKEDLYVALPEDNHDFNSLATELASNLQRSVPTDRDRLATWQQSRRKQLTSIVRGKDFHTLAILQSENTSDKLTARSWWLRFDGDWTVPAVELSSPGTSSNKVAIVVSDTGRSSVADRTTSLLADGYRVLAVDPFYFGESKIAQRDFLFAILVSSIGDRPLGLQSSQLTAIAQWLRSDRNAVTVELVAEGPRLSLIALTAAALKEHAFDRVRLKESLGSLHELLEQNLGMNQVPEALCFGLLQQFDICDLMALAGSNKVEFENPSERVTADVLPMQTQLQQ